MISMNDLTQLDAQHQGIHQLLNAGVDFNPNWRSEIDCSGNCYLADASDDLSPQIMPPPIQNVVANFLHHITHDALNKYHRAGLIPDHGPEYLAVLQAVHQRYINRCGGDPDDLTLHINYDCRQFTRNDYTDSHALHQYAVNLAATDMPLDKIADKIVNRIKDIRTGRAARA